MEMLYVMYMYLILWDIPGTINDKLKVVYPSKTRKKSYSNQINFASSTLPHFDTLLASIYFNSSYSINPRENDRQEKMV